MLPVEVSEYLLSHREEHLASLCELLRFESIANVKTPDGCGPCAQWLAEYLRGMGIDAEILPTGGQPCVAGRLHVSDDAPTLLVYAHYDVQPPEPLDLWESGPFDPQVRDGWLYARGSSDDKGLLFMHIMAIEAWMKSALLPVNIKLLFEGEEEIGSPSIEPFLKEHRRRFAADALVISDTTFFAEGCPAITTGLRGLCSCEITFTGPDRDVHSGVEGGLLLNPINALARLLAKMHDEAGRVTISGFYDDVQPPGRDELAAWAGLGFDESKHAEALGVDCLAGGEKNYDALHRSWARPTLDCNGISGGYQGPGDKTIIPSVASVKISMRLAPAQDPAKIIVGMRRFVADNTPRGIVANVEFRAAARPVLLGTDSPAALAGRDAVAEAFGAEPAWIRTGASVPITEVFQRLLGLDAVMLGVGLPEDNIHSPNERFKLDHLYRGSVMAATFYANLAGCIKPHDP
jgi:acetylornithine deacetylase/succinyl-diaminopimelate desuccinylase-like protein